KPAGAEPSGRARAEEEPSTEGAEEDPRTTAGDEQGRNQGPLVDSDGGKRDYYEVLGMPKTANEKDIKSAFRKLARQYHPDVNPGDKDAEARFKEANEAYEVLGDPWKRRLYDRYGPMKRGRP